MIPFLLPGCTVTNTRHVGETLVVEAMTTAATAWCPRCHQPATRLHSHYRRAPRDLPVSAQRILLLLTVRQFFCDQPLCAQQTFAETISDLLPRNAQRTTRLTCALQHLGWVLGGAAGARLAGHLRIRTSPDTVVRILRQSMPIVVPPPRWLGVDDFALRKGRVYGTLLVDLERRRPVDLLPDRRAETLAIWLRAHPGVEIITRDRSTEFTRGATDGAPAAIQVADRWHLLTNLRETLERMLQRRMPQLAQLPPLPTLDGMTPAAPAAHPQRRTVRERAARQVRREARAVHFQVIQQLTQQGMNILQIADYLHISRQMVRRYRLTTEVPEPAVRRPELTLLTPYQPYLQQQWDSGRTNAAALWRAIKAQAYPGGYQQVARWAQGQRAADGIPPLPSRRPHAMVQQQLVAVPSAVRNNHGGMLPTSARQLAWLLVRNQAQLAPADAAHLRHLLQDAEVQIARLEPWLDACAAHPTPELQSFAVGIQQDVAAVRAALRLPYSNGPVEGQVTRLKLIKRQMYGRAKLDLLRRRVVDAA
jgi:transposase